MTPKITKGDFGEFGVTAQGSRMMFTFPTKTLQQPVLYFFDRRTKKFITRLSVPEDARIGFVYSVCVSGLPFSRLCYLIFRDGKMTMDAYARCVIGREKWMDESRYDCGYTIYGGFPSAKIYEWQQQSPQIAPEDMILYKLHMRGFTMRHGLSSGRRGNFHGLLDRLDELQDLGITSIEIMPLYDFEEIRYQSHLEMKDNGVRTLVRQRPCGTNYWGYGNACYYAPKASYFGGNHPDLHMKELVDGIHVRGMEIIMEISFEQPVSPDFITRVLLFWIRHYHVDGFHLLGAGIPMEAIADNPYLRTTKIFYDGIPQKLLYEEKGPKHLFVCNDNFLYPLRRLQNHMDGNAAEFADMIKRQGEQFGFVNYAASNTGFTLWDAYSYGEKHNEKNGEENRDGSNYNCSNNHGTEGPTKNKVINRTRMTCVRTAFACLLISQGIPMIFEGDECANSQGGNNNPYCQDNETGWVKFPGSKAGILLRAYVRELVRFRREHTALSNPFPMKLSDYHHTGMPDLSYHGKEPWIMGIGEEKKALGILFNGAYGRTEDEEDVMACFNFYYGEETFALPRLSKNRKWYFVTNTSLEKWDPSEKPLEDQSQVIVPGGTVSLLVGRKEDGSEHAEEQTEDHN